jgi:predicted ATPase
MVKPQKVVFTGAPASGKTTLMKSVNHSHIHTYNEVSRAVIDLAQAKGIRRPFLENPLAFSEALFEQRLHDYFSTSPKPIQFYDRGIHDVVAYLREIREEVPCGMHEDCADFTYDTVFVFPPWEEIYTQDTQRTENFSEAEKLHHALVETYHFYGMVCIEVPRDTIANRLRFILENL